MADVAIDVTGSMDTKSAPNQSHKDNTGSLEVADHKAWPQLTDRMDGTDTTVGTDGTNGVEANLRARINRTYTSILNLFNFNPKNLALSGPAARQWIGTRRENVRPWTTFVNTSNFRAPNSFPRLSNRVMRNIEYFQSNYLFVFLGLIAYCLITSPLLLIVVAASLGGCYILSLKNQEKKFSLFGKELTLAQQYGVVALCSMPVYYWAGAGQALFWVLGASWFLITIHAAFFNIDAVLSQQEDRFDLTMEQV